MTDPEATATAAFLILISVTGGVMPTFLMPQLDWTRENNYQKVALDYVESSRKSSAQVSILDAASGRPIQGAFVSYRQVSHEFMFTVGGSSPAFMSEWALSSLEVFPLNWTRIEPSEGDYHYEDYDRVVDYYLKTIPYAQLFIKLWVVPEAGWITKTSPPAYTRFNEIMTNQTAFQEFSAHVYDYVYHSASHLKAIQYWLTQMEINVPLYAANEAKRQLWTVQQAVEIDRVSAKAIRDANPNATILLGTSTPRFFGEDPRLYSDPLEFARMCITAGVDFDGVSIETWPYLTPADYYDYIGRLTALGKSVFIHEIQGFAAVPPGGDYLLRGRWSTFNEDSQATWLKYMFTVAYGKAGVIGIQWLWYQDQPAYEAGQAYPDGLIRLDGTPRKAYSTFTDLMKQFTTKGNETTDANGILAFRGFAGDYAFNITLPNGLTQQGLGHVYENKSNSIVLKVSTPKAVTSQSVSQTTSKLTSLETSTAQAVYMAKASAWFSIALVAVAAITFLFFSVRRKRRNPVSH
jgi:hypothetical protein